MKYYFWDFVGSTIEGITICFLLRLFSSVYQEKKVRQLLAVLTMAVVVLLTSKFTLPVGYIMNYGAFILALSLAVRRRVTTVTRELLLAIAIEGISQALCIIVLNWIGIMPINVPSAENLWMLLPLLVLSFLLGANKKIRMKLNALYDTFQNEMCVIALNLFLMYQTEVYFWDAEHKVWIQNKHLIFIFVLIWIVLNSILLKNLIENKKQKELIRIHDQQMSMTNRFYDEILAEKHEFNRHLHFISACIETNVPEKAVHLIGQYLEDMAAINSKKEILTFDMTCNDDLNALLYDERKKWEKYSITIICTSDNQFDFPFHRYEFIEVIGNLIQNACEHVSKMSIEKRIVWITIGKMDNKRCIAVKNVLVREDENEQTSAFFKKGYSTKKGKGKGYGLYNVSQIVEKYKGTLETVMDGDCLIIRVLFP